MGKFYAVLKGHRPGLYLSWDDCKQQVDGFAGAVYKAFVQRDDAEAFLGKPVVRREPPVVQSTALAPAGIKGLKDIVIYTDGACLRNPGPGGYGAVITHKEHRKEISGGFRLTTNNRMEILACVAALNALREPCQVSLFSDSKYVVDTMSKSWAVKWRRNGWKRRTETGEQKDVLNRDLWVQMLALCDRHTVQFNWVRGHSGVPENERCDQLARAAATGSSLEIDIEYEKPSN